MKYRDWEILEELPDGWVIDKTAGSPCANTVFITNGKSVLHGQKRALLKITATPKQAEEKKPEPIKEIAPQLSEIVEKFPAKSVNQLARLKFKEQILKEILFDLMVCEIEGWDKREYISELKKLLNSINTSSNKPKGEQQTLF